MLPSQPPQPTTPAAMFARLSFSALLAALFAVFLISAPLPTAAKRTGTSGSNAKSAATKVASAVKKKKKKKSSSESEPQETEDPVLSDAESDDDDPLCFPGSATVTLASGVKRAMRDLSVGDRVLVAPGVFSDVFAFTHRLGAGAHNFVALRTAAGSLIATAGHYVRVNGALAPAGAVRVSDMLRDARGVDMEVLAVEGVKDEGLYNPQTVHGEIVVDGFQASTYTTAVKPEVAHVALAPWRWAYAAFGVQSAVLESGPGVARGILPVRN